jgi:hypothetical protein
VSGANFWLLTHLKKRFSEALTNSSGQSLEQTLARQHSQVAAVDAKLDKLQEAYRQLAQVASLSSQKISVVRFNPFGDTGGDQSFTLAVLDAHDSGYVLTSIHGREGTRVYIKPIDMGKSKYVLSKEEQQALDQAAKRVPGGKNA